MKIKQHDLAVLFLAFLLTAALLNGCAGITPPTPEDMIKQRIPEFIEQYPELFKKIIQKQDMAPMKVNWGG